MIVVMAATGRTGHRIVTELLQAGEPVRALGRASDRLSALAAAGAETLAGDPTDAAYLAAAFRGADVAYTLMPYGIDTRGYHALQQRQGEAIVQAVRDSGLRRVVALSSVGADLPSGTGVLVTMHRQEERLRALDGVDTLVLRAGAFFENLYGALGMIHATGFNGDAYAPDRPLPMIASRDIADHAARALRARDWRGFQVRELLGQRDIGYAEATRIIGERIGLPDLAYVRLDDAEAVDAMVQGGFSPELAQLYLELAHAVNDGRVRAHEPRAAANTTPTTLEAFADELAEAYRAM